MELTDICRKRAKEIGPEWSDSALFISVADELESLKAQLAECRDKALEEAAILVEMRGKKIGGAIQPEQTALSIRSLKGTKP